MNKQQLFPTAAGAPRTYAQAKMYLARNGIGPFAGPEYRPLAARPQEFAAQAAYDPAANLATGTAIAVDAAEGGNMFNQWRADGRIMWRSILWALLVVLIALAIIGLVGWLGDIAWWWILLAMFVVVGIWFIAKLFWAAIVVGLTVLVILAAAFLKPEFPTEGQRQVAVVEPSTTVPQAPVQPAQAPEAATQVVDIDDLPEYQKLVEQTNQLEQDLEGMTRDRNELGQEVARLDAEVARLSALKKCPIQDNADLRSALHERFRSDEKLAPLWDEFAAAYDRSDYELVEIKVDGRKTDYRIWASPFGREFAEVNMLAHVDDQLAGKVSVRVYNLGEQRVSVITDGCSCLYLAVGVKPQPAPKRRSTPPHHEPPVVRYDPPTTYINEVPRIICRTCVE